MALELHAPLTGKDRCPQETAGSQRPPDGKERVRGGPWDEFSPAQAHGLIL